MASREFHDEHGVFWTVWEVVPQMSDRRKRHLGPPGGLERRRMRLGPFASVPADYARGWLAFQSAGDRRRLAPTPEGWEDLPDAELSALCAKARSAGAPRRLP